MAEGEKEMWKVDTQELKGAIACAGFALEEAEVCRMKHLAHIASSKIVVVPMKELRDLTDAALELLKLRGEG